MGSPTREGAPPSPRRPRRGRSGRFRGRRWGRYALRFPGVRSLSSPDAARRPIMTTHPSTPVASSAATSAEQVALPRPAGDGQAGHGPPQPDREGEKKHGLKVRKLGPSRTSGSSGLFALEYGVAIPGQPTSTMLASLALARSRCTRCDSRSWARSPRWTTPSLREQGGAYATALTLYGMLKKVGHRHEQIRAGSSR